MKQDEIDMVDGLQMFLGNEDIGFCLVEDKVKCGFYIFNYFEYDLGMLKQEYD